MKSVQAELMQIASQLDSDGRILRQPQSLTAWFTIREFWSR
jgi:hypothetical protein